MFQFVTDREKQSLKRGVKGFLAASTASIAVSMIVAQTLVIGEAAVAKAIGEGLMAGLLLGGWKQMDGPKYKA